MSVNPDGTPGYVASGELIESTWGNATSDSIKRVMLPNKVGGLSDVGGLLRIEGAYFSGTTDGSGDITITIGGPIGTSSAPFSGNPLVVVTPQTLTSMTMSVITTSSTAFTVRCFNPATGATLPSLAVAFFYLAVGRRTP
jgi:hypothetical protein